MCGKTQAEEIRSSNDCSKGHKWSKWSKPTTKSIVMIDTQGIVGHTHTQERYCELCNEQEVKVTKTTAI